MFDWLTGRRAAPEASAACSFCKKSQREVRKLIAGPEVMICDECVALSAAIIEEQPLEGERFVIAIEVLCAHITGVDTPAERVEAAAGAALVLAGDDPTVLRRIVAAAFQGQRYAVGLAAAERIVDPLFKDHNDAAVLLYNLGDYEEGEARLASAEPSTPVDRALVELNRVAFLLRRWRNLDVGRLERALVTLRENAPMLVEGYANNIATSRAECLLRLGRPGEAKTELLAREALGPLTAIQNLVLGQAELALGEPADGIAHLRRASEVDNPIGAEAKKHLARALSDPYR